jgi:hypothetical protein
VLDFFGVMTGWCGAAGSLRGKQNDTGCAGESLQQARCPLDIAAEVFIARTTEEHAGAMDYAVHLSQFAKVPLRRFGFDDPKFVRVRHAFALQLRVKFFGGTDWSDDFGDSVVAERT